MTAPNTLSIHIHANTGVLLLFSERGSSTRHDTHRRRWDGQHGAQVADAEQSNSSDGEAEERAVLGPEEGEVLVVEVPGFRGVEKGRRGVSLSALPARARPEKRIDSARGQPLPPLVFPEVLQRALGSRRNAV